MVRRALICLVMLVLLAAPALAQSAAIVAIGDSNTAGFGVAREEAFPARLEALLRAAGHDVQVWNAGVTGDTFQGILARLDRYVPDGVRIAIVQAGYNDLLRRTDPGMLVNQLEAILARLRTRRVTVVLCGFFYPDWDAIGAALARNHGAVFVSGGTCYDRSYRGSDGLHMSAAGHQVVAGRLLPVVQRLLAPPPHLIRAHQTNGNAARRGAAARAHHQAAGPRVMQGVNGEGRMRGRADRNGRME